MKTSVLVVLLVQLLVMAAATQLQEEWETWKKTYNKVYDSTTEEARRHGIWMKNKLYVEEHNRNHKEHGFTLAMNKFGDLDESDMKQRKGLLPEKMTEEEIRQHMVVRPKSLNGTLPPSVDWRDKGAVLLVKDQKQCGSCWSFSITGTIEGQNYLKNQVQIPLSEQNLMDCSKAYGNQGCDGGTASASYKYIIQNGGIDTEASYPYTAMDGVACLYNYTNKGASLTDYKMLPVRDELALTTAIANIGPISVAIDASRRSFDLYNGTGIYYDPLCSTFILDHMVLAVGYGSENGKDYYIVKNSWGTSWGAEGYIKMARNKNNNCGIATSATYPIL